MIKKYVISLDQGTTSSRCIIFDRRGNIVSKAQREFPQIYPRAGWVEHVPEEILAGQLGVLSEAVALAGIDSAEIASMGITNQRETVIVWNKNTGKPVYNAIVWQCRRTAEYCQKLKDDGLEPLIYAKTGLYLDAYFSASKVKWILDNVAGAGAAAKKGELLFGTVDTYLLWHLTKGKVHATEYTNASRTMLFNIHTRTWDEELLELFGIPQKMLPKLLPSASDFGTTEEGVCGIKVPVGAMLGDQQAALFGQLCVEKGDIKNTYGTGCFMLMNTGGEAVKSKRGLLTTVAAGRNGEPVYALEGSVFVGGAVVQWLRDEMRLIRASSDSEMYAMRVPDTNGIYIVPSFVGLGAPYWDSDARGIVTGITRGVKKEHFIRAALESIAYQTLDVLHAMQSDSNQKISALAVDGGASANNFLMQFQADISGVSVRRPKVVETTALGAAYLSGLSQGFWGSFEELKNNIADYTVFSPAMEEKRRKELIEGWGNAIYKARAR